MNDDQLLRAKKKVKKKKDFYKHLGVFIAVGAFLGGLNYITAIDSGDHFPWAAIPMMAWGVALLIQYFSIFGLPYIHDHDEDWEEKEIAKELRKIQRREEGIVSDDFEELDLNEKQIIKENRGDADFV